MKQLLYSILLLLLCQNIYSQTGVDFWFVAPEVTKGHGDRPITLRVSSFANPVKVKISQPANPSFANIVFNLQANSTQSIDLSPFINFIENKPANTVLNYGIRITATGTIAAYYEVETGNNTDIFSLKASNGVGLEFWVPAQEFWASASKYSPQAVNAIDIVATRKNTTVIITPSVNCIGHAANVPFTVLLQKGQTYSLVAIGTATTNKLGGTKITSDKGIAVTISDDSVENGKYGGCKDLMGDQLIPTNKIGNEYIVMKGFLNKSGTSFDDKVYVLAITNNTSIYINGNPVPSVVLQQGQQYEISLSDPTVYIQASNDVYVLHVTGFGCEVGAAVLPSVQCTGSEVVTITRSQKLDFYMVVLVPAGGETSFLVNGVANVLRSTQFTAVPGTGGQWMAARAKFADNIITTGQTYRIENAKKNFHLGIINGGSTTGCMYGYFSDFGSVTTEPIYHF